MSAPDERPRWVEVIDADETGQVLYRFTPAGVARIKALLHREQAKVRDAHP